MILNETTIDFSTFGVAVRVQTDDSDQTLRLKQKLADLFRNNMSPATAGNPDFSFQLRSGSAGNLDLFKNGEYVISGPVGDRFFDYAETQIRLAVAEYAIEHVFVHAGVVSLGGKAIVIPGNSLSGKTTLVHALVCRGAEYLSDEYAVFDKDGFVVPFPKPLSIREDPSNSLQTDRPIEEIGGKVAVRPVAPAVVLFTEFRSDSDWEPQSLTSGTGVLKLLEHTLPIRRSPQFSMDVLTKASEGAAFYETYRPDTADAVERILELIEVIPAANGESK